MKSIQNIIGSALIYLLAFLLLTSEAYARSGGGGGSVSGDSGLSVGFASISTDQKAVNGVASANGAADLPSAYEFFADYEFRFSRTMFSVLFRPSYYTQSSSKTCSGASCDYKMSGYTIFPVFRLYPLENSFIKFYMQCGLGYGNLSADLTNATSSIKFSGSGIGYVAGLGVNFCFTDAHCLVIEGNARYLPIERNIASSATGTVAGLNQATTNMEVEDANSNDLRTSMSGVQGIIGYHMNF